MISIKHTQQHNSQPTITLLCVILIVSRYTSLLLFLLRSSYFSLCTRVDAMIEQRMPMTAASMFWMDTLHDCHLDRSLPLPYDHYHVSDEHRTGRGTSISFDFGQDLSHHFVLFASLNSTTIEQLSLACYYAFLFKLCNGETDLCVGMNTDGRYREELMSVIGMFVNAVPLRCQLDPHWSFDRLVKCVVERMSESMDYSYYPLQCILAQHPNITKPTFLDTSFVFTASQHTHYGEVNRVMKIGDSQLERVPFSIKISEDEIISKFDFSVTIHHNLASNQLSCIIDASLDLFHVHTVDTIAQRFHLMLSQPFHGEQIQMDKPIYELSLLSWEEQLLLQSINNTQTRCPSSASSACIHHAFVDRVMRHPQKLSVELDDQSLTYAELLFYAQLLSLHLVKEHKVSVGDIVCQCVERSLPMVSDLILADRSK